MKNTFYLIPLLLFSLPLSAMQRSDKPLSAILSQAAVYMESPSNSKKHDISQTVEKLKLQRDIEAAKAEQLKLVKEHEDARGRWGLASEMAKAQREHELAKERQAEEHKLRKQLVREEHQLAKKRNKKVIKDTIKSKAGTHQKITFGDELDNFLRRQDALERQRMQEEESYKTQRMREREREQRKTRVEEAKIKAELDQQTLPERLEHDLKKTDMIHKQTMEKLQLWGQGFNTFISDPEKVTYATLGLAGCSLAYFASRKGSQVVGDHVAMLLRKPTLVTETSRLTLQQRFLAPFKTAINYGKPQPVAVAPFSELILPEATKNRLLELAQGLKHVQKNDGFHRHLLVYGPPGTGKTLLARELARSSGLDYAITSGANFDQFSEDQKIKELNKLFKWADNSPKGLLLFIDEADALLESRNKVSESTRKLLTAFLTHTGTETKKFMLVLATNRPEALDAAAISRIDQKEFIGLPDALGRKELLNLYFNKFVLDKGATVVNLSEEKLQEMAHKTAGFSGRDISKLAIHAQHAAFSTENKVISEHTMDRIVHEKIEQHNKAQNYVSHI